MSPEIQKFFESIKVSKRSIMLLVSPEPGHEDGGIIAVYDSADWPLEEVLEDVLVEHGQHDLREMFARVMAKIARDDLVTAVKALRDKKDDLSTKDKRN